MVFAPLDPRSPIRDPRSAIPTDMRTLHVDTARTWRGGQNQCLLTVLGLRALGHETLLVAHPDGELRRRAPQDKWLVPLAPKFEVDFHAAWRLARLMRAFKPAVVHAHD